MDSCGRSVVKDTGLLRFEEFFLMFDLRVLCGNIGLSLTWISMFLFYASCFWTKISGPAVVVFFL